ncbi:MAG: hypothetical protein K6C09_10740, partial [Oscillospiraceae bacterium]|nr:hypothetical protein [Oscillospiraceae bacterium]
MPVVTAAAVLFLGAALLLALALRRFLMVLLRLLLSVALNVALGVLMLRAFRLRLLFRLLAAGSVPPASARPSRPAAGGRTWSSSRSAR